MKYFVPDISVPSPSSPPALERLGGKPWGLPENLWPKCKVCGKSQSLLAQFQHHSERLDLGRPGRTLFVFQCNHDPGMCSTWDAKSGANACFIVEPEQLTNAEPKTPTDSPEIEKEVIITDWVERQDGIPESLRQGFFADDHYATIPEEELEKVTMSTRLGGVPFWIQSASEAPPVSEGWRFVGQLDSTYSFLNAKASMLSWAEIDSQKFEGRRYFAVGPNFGDMGIAYLFVRDAEPVPEALCFWQCS